MQSDLQLLTEHYKDAPDDINLSNINLECLPRHISIIMDGNGRWAQARGLDRTRGHAAGVDAVREAVTTCVRLGIDVLSAYAFSTENWKRPRREVDLLMHLFATTLVGELPLFHENNVQLRFFGDLSALPDRTRKVFERGVRETADHTGMIFALAVNYGGRAELVHAAQKLAHQVAAGQLQPQDIDEQAFENCLYSAGLPDPDVLIRTSGELRLSNYLLWQLAYTELYVTKTLWPDFDRWELLRAIYAYQGRSRRYGGVASS